jgi:ABC-2 type transport system ATP-binding protein
VVSRDTQYVIETFGLTKIFADWWGRSKVIAVDDLNISIRRNEVFGLLGPNGSGKTTTLKMILSLLYPTKGRVLVLGGESSDPKINAHIGFLPEESYLYRYLTAMETLDFYGRLFGLPKRVRQERIETLLDMVGLQGAANRQVGTFSKGMQRRIGLAQALINDPDLLILDEPTSGLDPIGTRQIKDLIIQLAKRGKTLLLSSHLLADVEDVCDRISILYGGKVRTEGKVSDLLMRKDQDQILTSKLSEGAIERIRAIAQAENATIEVSSPVDRLENFFINVVVQAQKEAHVTSGAVSATGISGFLAEPTPEKVLEGLVTGEPSALPKEPTKTEKVQAAEIKTPQADKGLLEQLSHADMKQESALEPVDKKKIAEVKPPKVDKSVLDDLTSSPDKQAKKPDKGEERDA